MLAAIMLNKTFAEQIVVLENDTTLIAAASSSTLNVNVEKLLGSDAVPHNINGVALLFLPILCLIGLIGNFLVCVAIASDRRLHNVTNYFLFSLALADLLVCCIVMPLSIVVEVRHGVWTWSVSMCLLYVYSDVFLCSASIVHMSVISLDRYLGISQPLRTRNKSRSLIFVKIAVVWMVTLLVSCPIAILAIHDTSNILQDNQCMIFSRYYIVYGSTMTFLIPFCIMAVTYVRTTALLNKQASILSQKANDKLNGNGLRRTMPHRKLGYVRTNSATVTLPYHNGKPSPIGIPPDAKCYQHVMNGSYSDISRLSTNRPSINGRRKSFDKASKIDRWRYRTSTYLTNIALKVGRRSSLQTASQELANEHKATRVLAVVFICFFICWTPFFVANFILGFCGSTCNIPAWLGSLFLWLGYISSTINPIIYTVFNKRFRQAFVRILRCQCCHPLRDPQAHYSRNFTTTIVPDTFTWSNNERATSVMIKDETLGGRVIANHRIRTKSAGENFSKKTSLPVLPKTTIPRETRSTTEETTATTTTTTTTDEENRPLLSKSIMPQTTIRKSYTAITIEPCPVSTSFAIDIDEPGPSNSQPCVDCRKADDMILSDMTDMTNSTVSTASNSKHLTLFNYFDGSMKETFL
ncbi:unnamed protein product [Caenorhabditis bovis]|uniref:G-protein coupled receptors family 1 profile domain-containing protein n=1 Tax=Caenorhabditis bovis TaxID=2654633 RepID=A0A8S1EK74_9PELO|nr:unnamed protein product [Caenorhabditis bovis]